MGLDVLRITNVRGKLLGKDKEESGISVVHLVIPGIIRQNPFFKQP